MSFDSKIALITGASGGIGKAIVESFVKSGTTVIAMGTNQDKLDNLKTELGDKIITQVCNLADTEKIPEIIKQLHEKVGKIDSLVCNAGITKDNLAIRIKDEDWDTVLDINLKATFVLNREVIKIMMKQRSGSIINISSIIGMMGNAGQANYAASKAGIIAMSKSLAQEVASRGVRVNVVAPGFIETPMTDVLNDTFKQKILEKIPLNFFGKPQNIADAVEFLASEKASYITGTTLHVNGGMAMF